MKLWKIVLFALIAIASSCSIQKRPQIQITHVLAVTHEGDTLKKITADIGKAYPDAEIKTCALVQNKNNVFTVDYHGVTINKAERPLWVVFACENWW